MKCTCRGVHCSNLSHFKCMPLHVWMQPESLREVSLFLVIYSEQASPSPINYNQDNSPCCTAGSLNPLTKEHSLLPWTNFSRNNVTNNQSNQVGGNWLGHLEDECVVFLLLLPGRSAHHSCEALRDLAKETPINRLQ